MKKIPPETETDDEQVLLHQVTDAECHPMFEQIHIATEEEEKDWVASWLEQSDQILACDNADTEVFLSELSTFTCSFDREKSLPFIIDSGASSTVCGIQWLKHASSRFKSAIPHCTTAEFQSF